MRKSGERIPYTPIRSQQCSLGEVVIYHHSRHFSGYWYALVPVRVPGSSETTLEVTLNGGGHSKAREKIERELRARGYGGFDVVIAKDFVERV